MNKNVFKLILQLIAMISWYESLDKMPENVTSESLRKILKRRHKLKISQSCAKFYENKHLCVSPFSKEMGVCRLLMADDHEQLIQEYRDEIGDL